MRKSKKSPVPNIIGAVLCLLLLPVVVVNLTLAIKGSLQPEKVATFLGWGPLIVDTGSMRPAFKEKDLLIMKECDAGTLAVNDIIAFYDAGGVVVSHRIIGLETDENGARLYTTKGDANNVEDRDPVRPSRVAGLVVRVIPEGGKWMEIAGRPIIMGLVLAVPLALWFGISGLAKALARRKTEGGVAQADE